VGLALPEKQGSGGSLEEHKMAPTTPLPDAGNKFEDLSGVEIKPGDNPFDALINACDNSPVSRPFPPYPAGDLDSDVELCKENEVVGEWKMASLKGKPSLVDSELCAGSGIWGERDQSAGPSVRSGETCRPPSSPLSLFGTRSTMASYGGREMLLHAGQCGRYRCQ
jgi:hypothetical protein